MKKCRVLPISYEQALPWMLKKHYAKRSCPVSHAFGLYEDGLLVGVCTFGTPVSAPLRSGVCGKVFADKVLELNRLCCEPSKNRASMLVSGALRLIPKPSIVVSYADMAMGHIGYVYQACNFLYTGLSAKRTDWKIKGMESLHGATVADMSRGQNNRAAFMREKFGDDFYLQDRPRKHRYVYFVGSKSDVKAMRSKLKYSVEPYPKGETKRYDFGEKILTQSVLDI